MNLRLKENVLSPAKGVYATKVILENGETHLAVTNIGTRPTVSDGNQLTIEGYILDFTGDLYGQKIQMEFYKYLREERKFPPLRHSLPRSCTTPTRPGVLRPAPLTDNPNKRRPLSQGTPGAAGRRFLSPADEQQARHAQAIPATWRRVRTSLYSRIPTTTRRQARAMLATRRPHSPSTPPGR